MLNLDERALWSRSAQLGEPKAKEAAVPVKLGPPWAGMEEATASHGNALPLGRSRMKNLLVIPEGFFST